MKAAFRASWSSSAMSAAIVLHGNGGERVAKGPSRRGRLSQASGAASPWILGSAGALRADPDLSRAILSQAGSHGKPRCHRSRHSRIGCGTSIPPPSATGLLSADWESLPVRGVCSDLASDRGEAVTRADAAPLSIVRNPARRATSLASAFTHRQNSRPLRNGRARLLLLTGSSSGRGFDEDLLSLLDQHLHVDASGLPLRGKRASQVAIAFAVRPGPEPAIGMARGCRKIGAVCRV